MAARERNEKLKNKTNAKKIHFDFLSWAAFSIFRTLVDGREGGQKAAMKKELQKSKTRSGRN